MLVALDFSHDGNEFRFSWLESTAESIGNLVPLPARRLFMDIFTLQQIGTGKKYFVGGRKILGTNRNQSSGCGRTSLQ